MVVEAVQGDDDGPGLLILRAPAQIGQPGAVLNHEGAAAEGSGLDARAVEAVGRGLGCLKMRRGAGGQGERKGQKACCQSATPKGHAKISAVLWRR
ncbi:hypothetical protein D3C72_913410 [compost metagenome]